MRIICFAPFYEWGLDYNPNLWMAEELKAHPELTETITDFDKRFAIIEP